MPLLTSRARHFLQPLKPLTLSIGFSFIVPLRFFGSAPDHSKVQCTRRLIRQPSPAASRESPYPIVFLRMKGVEGLEDETDWVDWSSMFAEKGYTSVEIDISSPTEFSKSSELEEMKEDISILKSMVNLLSSEIRLLSIPFPPILIAFGKSTILAQSFIEDNPSSGLILINPLSDKDERSIELQNKSNFKFPNFTFEPHFPILILSNQQSLRNLSVSNRLIREYGQLPNPNTDEEKKGWFKNRRNKGIEIGVLDEEGFESGLNENGRIQVERWMDRQGF
ncbi:uncharacterized protein I206_103719 [Kwoniella pini CBS 10737]|uniref:Uncharacterized protein n=1 Tax=Kwoniella pini CBS 10737 TaxID=1296096 RepID=A0A1B9I903_9TREE|nr:uncharacterized protein I206_01280 [Kwoniella pini CBS 10737]OCF51996.1 hypothetical protein I206_01280 [Kwoniella pini CBS 10737]